MGGARSLPGRWRCIGPRTLMASRWSGSLIGMAARSSRGEATCSPWLTSAPEPPAILQPRQPMDAAAGRVPRSAVHTRFGPRCRAGRWFHDRDRQVELPSGDAHGRAAYRGCGPRYRQVAGDTWVSAVQRRGHRSWSRPHLLLYDLLYEGHEDTMRLP